MAAPWSSSDRLVGTTISCGSIPNPTRPAATFRKKFLVGSELIPAKCPVAPARGNWPQRPLIWAMPVRAAIRERDEG